MKNTFNEPKFGIQTGFRIYSPDGASWGSTVGDTVSLGWDTMLDLGGCNIVNTNVDGYGADTIGFGGIALFSGLPGDFDETSYMITIGPIDESMDGKMICIDSSFFPPAGNWMWCAENGYTTSPPWNGTFCFEIEKTNTITYSGHLYYLDPVPPDTNPMPMRGIRIEMRDDETIGDVLLDSTTTEDDGSFSFGPIDNDDGFLQGNLDIFFRIYAENAAAYVTEDYNDDTYTITTPVQDELPSGVYDTTIIAPIDSAGAFYIADAVLEAHNYWQSLTGYDLDIVQVVSDHKAIGSEYYPDDNEHYMFIEGATEYDGFWPDIYETDIIFHEYAHFIEDTLNFFDASPGGDHSWISEISDSLAATEGFAYFFCNIYKDDPVFGQYNCNYAYYGWENLENGQEGVNDSTYCSVNDWGAINEGAVAGVLWDIYDYSPTTLPIQDDYSSPPLDAWPNLSDTADGIGDTLSDGVATILNVLLNRTIDGHHPEDINQFWTAWFQSPSKGHAKAMRDIFYEHGIITCGDVNGDGFINLGDAVYLMNFIFRGGPAPDPLESGDVNSDSRVNIGDPVYLINYIFKDGPEPCAWQ